MGAGGAGRSSFEILIVQRGISYVFLWTEKDPAFLGRPWTEMPGTPTQRLQVKMIIKSRTSFYEYPFNNTAHCHVLTRYSISCVCWERGRGVRGGALLKF